MKRAWASQFGGYLSSLVMVMGLSLATISPAAQAEGLIHSHASSFEAWVNQQTEKSVQGVLLNLSPEGTARGVITASPSRRDPDYFYHWVRDAALVSQVVIDLSEGRISSSESARFGGMLREMIEFSRRLQLLPNLSGGLGEPKFRVDGSAYLEEWGRPQNDGPALRASAFTRYAHLLLDRSQDESWVRTQLYDGRLPTHSLIKADLEFVAHNWKESSFDLWEEVRGQHFYTRMVQRKALIEGAALADRLADGGAASYYRQQARELEKEILKHWDTQKGYLLATLDWSGGHSGKDSGLDVAVILGVLHGETQDGFFTPASAPVLATAERVREAFQRLYLINSRAEGELGTAIGRYPEDIYDGVSSGNQLGNPWVLATLSYAELSYRIAREWISQKKIAVNPTNVSFFRHLMAGSQNRRLLAVPGMTWVKGTQAYEQVVRLVVEQGDSYLRRVRRHCPADLSLAEQMNRNTGYMQGARDLAWSYASFLTALEERSRVKTLMQTLGR